MKKTHVLGLALVAVFAFSVVSVASASAHEWLHKGVTVTGEETGVTSSGTIELHKEGGLGGAAVIECTGEFVGTVNTGGKSTVTKVVKGTEEGTIKCTSLSGLCGTNTSVNVTALNLPWSGLLVELTNKKTPAESFVANEAKGTGGEPGYEVSCGLSVSCTGTEFEFLKAINVEPAVFEFLHESTGQERESGLSSCTDGGSGWVTGSGSVAGYSAN
jgi:hypothetical protein